MELKERSVLQPAIFKRSVLNYMLYDLFVGFFGIWDLGLHGFFFLKISS